MATVALLAGKLVLFLIKLFRFGEGSTWPGEVALSLAPPIATQLARQLRQGSIIVAGTNGKTTTALMIKRILEDQGKAVLLNASGANLLNGLVSVFIQNSSLTGRTTADWGVFEVDENSLPLILKYIKPKVVVLLNLFRDQLDRYGEIDVIAEKWQKALRRLTTDTLVVLNADDPAVAFLANNLKSGVQFFGLNDSRSYLKNREHATDSIFCLNCGGRLTYEGIYFSHLGVWSCKKCGQKRPRPDTSDCPSSLPGLYNRYNALAASCVASALGVQKTKINATLKDFSPAFGRQEEFTVDGRTIKIFLSKNPAGFNASLRTVLDLGAQNLLLALNDRIPDGRDVSWIWDVDFEIIPENIRIIVSGERVYDMALRLKYAQISQKLVVEPDLSRSIRLAVATTPKGNTLFVLPTYSAMLEVRKILSGRKIL